MIPTAVPHGRTARRLTWPHLPPHLRAEIERRCGSEVLEALSQDSGFTPGFASVLLCADGSRHFVKAASVKAQRIFAHSYREEAAKLKRLPPGTPAPRLRWLHDDGDWVALGIEHVTARAPYRPWTADDLAVVSDALVAIAQQLTPTPMPLDSAADEFSGWPALWDRIEHPHGAELSDLAARYADVVAGETLVHTDIRDDNLLIEPDGRVLLCDWNWPVAGPAWLDSLILLIGPRGDGLDVEAHLAAHPLLGAVAADDIDVVLALLLGYFTHSAAQPVPPTSPYLREAQAWQRDVLDDWLAERRGWA